MKKQLQLFLTADDEMQLSKLLKETLAGIIFIDDNVWPQSPHCRDGIEDCESGRAYLYHGQLADLPTAIRKSGDIEGPVAGCVIQILRSRREGATLASGRIAAGIDNDDVRMRKFVSDVWNCVRKTGSLGVMKFDGEIDRNYLVGHHARNDVANGTLAIVDRAIGIKFQLAIL